MGRLSTDIIVTKNVKKKSFSIISATAASKNYDGKKFTPAYYIKACNPKGLKYIKSNIKSGINDVNVEYALSACNAEYFVDIFNNPFKLEGIDTTISFVSFK